MASDFRQRMDDETLRYATEAFRDLADKYERLGREAADREAAGDGDGLIPQSSELLTSRPDEYLTARDRRMLSELGHRD